MSKPRKLLVVEGWLYACTARVLRGKVIGVRELLLKPGLVPHVHAKEVRDEGDSVRVEITGSAVETKA